MFLIIILYYQIKTPTVGKTLVGKISIPYNYMYIYKYICIKKKYHLPNKKEMRFPIKKKGKYFEK